MGVIKRGILGGISGKVANVVGGSWKGIAYLRSLPLSVANPNTPAQQAVRGAFSNCTAFAVKILGAILQPFWNQYASGQSGYNLFIQRNVSEFDTSGLANPSGLLTTIGTVTPAVLSSVVGNSGPSTVVLDWTDNTGQGNAQAGDETIIVIYNETTNQVFTSVGLATRATATETVSGVTMSGGDTMHAWMSFSKTDGQSGTPDYFSFTAL